METILNPLLNVKIIDLIGLIIIKKLEKSD